MDIENLFGQDFRKVSNRLTTEHRASLVGRIKREAIGTRVTEGRAAKLRVSQVRQLSLRISELLELGLTYVNSAKGLYELFTSPVFSDISITIEEYIDLGVPREAILASVLEIRGP